MRQFLDEVISEIKKLWPECLMVKGSPRRKEANGGIERLNQTVENKIGTILKDHGSKKWATLCKLVQWRVNTQQHSSVKAMPYQLLTGQRPRVGISGLPIAKELLETLTTEAALNRILHIPEDGRIEDSTINLASGATRSADSAEDEEENELPPLPMPAVEVGAGGTMTIDGGGGDDDEEEMHDNNNDDDCAAGRDASSRQQSRAGAASGSRPTSTDGTSIGNKRKRGSTPAPVKTTKWLELVGDFKRIRLLKTFGLDDLKDTGIREMIPVEDCDDLATNEWRQSILVRVKKDLWEIRAQDGTSVLDTVAGTGDHGLYNEWGSYYRMPSQDSIFAAEDEAEKQASAEADGDERIMESPGRRSLRSAAHQNLTKQADTMKRRAKDVAGDVKVGSIVHVPLDDVDSTKVDGKNITAVVVEIVRSSEKAPPRYRVAVKNGVLSTMQPRHGMTLVKTATPELMGLQETLGSWAGLPSITFREAARGASTVGGQGVTKCNCNGKCDSNRCSCYKAGRVCNSRCHRGNSKCKNHDDCNER